MFQLQAAGDTMPERNYLARVERNWERFIANKPIDHGAVRPDVLSSWERCRRQGVDPFRREVSRTLPDDQAHRLRVRNELLLEALLGQILPLRQELDRRRCAIVAADAEGLLLTIDGNRDYVAHLCQDWSAPGFLWDEGRTGTNAVGTALALGCGIQINAHEHFCQSEKRLTCVAELVRDPVDHRVLGQVAESIVISASVEWAHIQDVYAGARWSGEGLVAFDRYGRVVAGHGVEGILAGQAFNDLDADHVRNRTLPDTLEAMRPELGISRTTIYRRLGKYRH